MTSRGLVAAALALISAAASGQAPSVNLVDDRPGARSCSVPIGLAPDAADLNNQPQGEVWLDIAEDGRLAAASKDSRFAPVDDTTYNARIWNVLFVSNDGGRGWRNLAFEDATPDSGVSGATSGAYGRPAGQVLRLTHESDPVVAFDRDGNVYTCALAYEPGAPGDPSAVVVSRRDRDARLVPGTTHLIGLEGDPQLFNDKNWLAVDRESPAERTLVVASLRLFSGSDPLAPEGGYVAVSGDGARSFSPPIRLPVPAAQASQSQFYQPLVGRDPGSGRRVLYVVLRTVSGGDFALAMHVVKADLEGAEGTAALEARLRDPASWSWLPDRVSGLFSYGASGYDGGFRFGSFFQPALDLDTGVLYAVTHAFDPATRRSRALVTRSSDGALSWTPPRPIDDQPRGEQFMPAVAARGGRVYAVWYDSRNDPEYAPLSPIRALDVYAAALDAELGPAQVSRLTPESQRADRPAFTRPRPAGVASRAGERPHDHDPALERGARAAAIGDCASERYGFIGDYIGIAANASEAWAAWTDLRSVTGESDVCAGHSCAGNRNQSVHAVRIHPAR